VTAFRHNLHSNISAPTSSISASTSSLILASRTLNYISLGNAFPTSICVIHALFVKLEHVAQMIKDVSVWRTPRLRIVAVIPPTAILVPTRQDHTGAVLEKRHGGHAR
jgi:hypothetical protein